MSTVAYTPTNLSLEADTALYGGAKLRTAASKIWLAWNRPAVDSNHTGFWLLNDGTGTNANDESANANDGTLGASNPSWMKDTISPAFMGAAAVVIGANQYINAGAVLQYERTQPWTCIAVIKVPSNPGTAAILFSNMNVSPYPGFEVFLNSSGQLHCRIMNSFFAPNYVGVRGTVDIADGVWRVIAVTYDGSSTAAGVKLYVDGSAVSMVTESDTLSASIVNSEVFRIGNQTGELGTFQLGGSLDEFSMHKVARSASYIAAHADRYSLVSVDSDVELYYKFDEGTGTTVNDETTNNRDGTLQASSMWVAGYPVEWLGTSCINCSGADDAVTCSHIGDYNLPAAFTLSCWANSRVAPGLGCLFFHVGADPYPGWAYHPGYQNVQQFWDGAAFRSSAIAASLGWHHYCVKLSGGTLTFYVDGSSIATASCNTPSTVTTSLLLGRWPGIANWTGLISHATISKIARSDTFISDFAKRHPPSGIAKLTAPGTAIASGGGDFGEEVNITQLAATFYKPSTTNLQYRIGTGSSAAAATSDKEAAAFVTLGATNSISKTGRHVDFDVKLIPSTDTIKVDSPFLADVTLTYAPSATPVSNAIETGMEALGRIASGNETSHEALGRLAISGETSIEALGRIVQSIESSHEALGLVPSSQESSWESLGLIPSARESSHEALGRIVVPGESSHEALGYVAQGGETSHEALGRIVSSLETSHEALGRIAQALETSWESTGQTAVSNAIETSTEALGRIVASVESFWESLGRIAVSGESSHEALGRIVLAGETSIEALGLVASAVESSWESLGLVLSGGETSHEALGRLAVALETAHEALGRVAQSGETSWESLSGLLAVSSAVETSMEALGLVVSSRETSYEGFGALILALIRIDFEVAKILTADFELARTIALDAELAKTLTVEMEM